MAFLRNTTTDALWLWALDKTIPAGGAIEVSDPDAAAFTGHPLISVEWEPLTTVVPEPTTEPDPVQVVDQPADNVPVPVSNVQDEIAHLQDEIAHLQQPEATPAEPTQEVTQ